MGCCGVEPHTEVFGRGLPPRDLRWSSAGLAREVQPFLNEAPELRFGPLDHDRSGASDAVPDGSPTRVCVSEGGSNSMRVDAGPDVEKELLEGGIWIRGLYMLLFVLIYGVAELVVAAVAVAQFGWIIVAHERNHRLERFGMSLSRFVYQVVCYWTFTSEFKPFPFSEWPDAEG